MFHKGFTLIILCLITIPLISGCGKGKGDISPPVILSLSVEPEGTCPDVITLPCVHKDIPWEQKSINIHLVARDDTGIGGYYISQSNELIPSNWISVIPPTLSYDDIIKYTFIPDSSSTGDGIHRINVWVKDLGGNLSPMISTRFVFLSGTFLDGQEELIDQGRNFSQGLTAHFLRVDPTGIYIVAGGEKIWKFTKDTLWTSEAIDNPAPGLAHPGIYMDDSHNIHMAFTDQEGHLVYEMYSNGIWTGPVIVGSSTFTGEYVDITGTPDGTLVITFYDRSDSHLKYAICTGGCTDRNGWIVNTGDTSTDDTGLYSAVATGSDGSIHIVYYDSTTGGLRYLHTGSQPEVVTSRGSIFADIAVDTNGRAHVAYYDDSGALHYATNQSSQWTDISVDTQAVVTKDFLSIDTFDGITGIAYYDTKQGVLKYATCPGNCETSSNWTVLTIDPEGDTGWSSRLSHDPDTGAIHISYFASTDRSIRHATCISNCTDLQNWKIEKVAVSGDTGKANQMVIDPDNNIHISYISGGFLKYATNKNGSWTTTIVDRGDSTGDGTAIDISPVDSSIHIVYYDSISKNLKYATCSTDCSVQTNWRTITVQEGTGGGFFNPSMKIDPAGGIHISYQNGDTKNLEYAYCGGDCTADNDGDGRGDNWQIVVVDGTGSDDVGKYSSIGIDASGGIHITYFDASLGYLRYAYCASDCLSASNWHRVTIDNGDRGTGQAHRVGLYTSTGIDSSGYVHIVYYDQTEGALKYIESLSPVGNDWTTRIMTEANWPSVTIDNYDIAGLYASMAIDPMDNSIHVAYFRLSEGMGVLKYAVCTHNCLQDVDDVFSSGLSDGIGDNWETFILKVFHNREAFTSTGTGIKPYVTFYDGDRKGLFITRLN